MCTVDANPVEIRTHNFTIVPFLWHFIIGKCGFFFSSVATFCQVSPHDKQLHASFRPNVKCTCYGRMAWCHLCNDWWWCIKGYANVNRFVCTKWNNTMRQVLCGQWKWDHVESINTIIVVVCCSAGTQREKVVMLRIHRIRIIRMLDVPFDKFNTFRLMKCELLFNFVFVDPPRHICMTWHTDLVHTRARTAWSLKFELAS